MPKKITIENNSTIPAGGHLHLTYKTVKKTPLNVIITSNTKVTAEAMLDSEGWVVIIITNPGKTAVFITPDEPLWLLVTAQDPQPQQSRVE